MPSRKLTTARVRNAAERMEETGNLIHRYTFFNKEIKLTSKVVMPLNEDDEKLDQHL